MSDANNQTQKTAGNLPIPQLKDAAILAGWIAALILLAALLWFLSLSVRSRFLMTSVNQSLEQSGSSRRLGTAIPRGAIKPSLSGIGSWYNLTEHSARQAADSPGKGEKAVIFTLIAEGSSFPCLAVLNASGTLAEFIPLSGHGEKMMKRVSPGILGVYTRRIEEAGK